MVLVAPRNPLNIGAAARAMSNFGFTELRLVNPYEVAFREARSAVGAGKLLGGAREYPGLAEAVADCTLVVGTTSGGRRELHHSLRRLEYGGRLIRTQLEAAPAALVFGSEKYGLSNEDLSHCHWLLRIPTRDEHASMNLGQAVALCLYELVRVRPSSIRAASRQAADSAGLERILARLMEILELSGYTGGGARPSTAVKMRRMLRRTAIEERDVEVWLGMLRQIRWKISGDVA